MTGQKINKAVLHVARQIGGSQEIVYELTLENVKVAAAKVSTIADKIDGSTNYQTIEEVKLVVGKMTRKVTPIKPDNTKDGAVEANFDQTINK